MIKSTFSIAGIPPGLLSPLKGKRQIVLGLSAERQLPRGCSLKKKIRTVLRLAPDTLSHFRSLFVWWKNTRNRHPLRDNALYQRELWMLSEVDSCVTSSSISPMPVWEVSDGNACLCLFKTNPKSKPKAQGCLMCSSSFFQQMVTL